VPRLWGKFENLFQVGTRKRITGSAIIQLSVQNTFSDCTHLLAVIGLYARGPATLTVDVLRLDGHAIQIRPLLRDLVSKHIIVIAGCDEGLAFFTIKSAARDHGSSPRRTRDNLGYSRDYYEKPAIQLL
jgi:hypothetical protein